ncbi:MAG: hypothetical protein A2066_20950 [Bacteroidetes bacterium GWB2_41_8]|nr:MAG: hypothetical protein A2066_20950 [Bacteroidetes bacterium GWB2_41_8]
MVCKGIVIHQNSNTLQSVLRIFPLKRLAKVLITNRKHNKTLKINELFSFVKKKSTWQLKTNSIRKLKPGVSALI